MRFLCPLSPWDLRHIPRLTYGMKFLSFHFIVWCKSQNNSSLLSRAEALSWDCFLLPPCSGRGYTELAFLWIFGWLYKWSHEFSFCKINSYVSCLFFFSNKFSGYMFERIWMLYWVYQTVVKVLRMSLHCSLISNTHADNLFQFLTQVIICVSVFFHNQLEYRLSKFYWSYQISILVFFHCFPVMHISTVIFIFFLILLLLIGKIPFFD